MPIHEKNYQYIKDYCQKKKATLIAVSKKRTIEDILNLYHLGQRDFGESYVKELIEKQALLPQDIRWHFIGHLQKNKIKYLAPFIHLIHSIDSLALLNDLIKHSIKIQRQINFLLEIKISNDLNKYGIKENELPSILKVATLNSNQVNCLGFMAMGSFTNDENLLKNEFAKIRQLFEQYKSENFSILSLGMSNDYKLALDFNSSMVRIGSLLFI